MTVAAPGVSDADTDDPPDTMAADYVVRLLDDRRLTLRIYEIQGAAHLSPFAGELVAACPA